MKKLFILLSVAACMTSCNDFIDLEPISQQNAGTFYKDSLEIGQALNAAYNSLQSVDEYGSEKGYASFMEISSDNTYNSNTTQNGGAYASFDNFTIEPTNVQIEATWIACYAGIQRCNIVLTRLESNSTVSDKYKKRVKGEAEFLRALTYFNMVRIWGGVPLITKEVADVNEAFKHERSTVDAVYEQIIADLKDASANLPLSYDAANLGRATQGAAKTLLAKVYLTRKDYGNALTLLNEVIASGQYALLPDFADVFSTNNKNNKESIFEVQFDKTLAGQGYMGADPLLQSSDVNNLPSENLLKLFDENPDDRKAATVIDKGVYGWRLYKWHDTKGDNNGMGFDIMVLRYADVLLMASEIMNEQQYGQQMALDYLNAIRKRSHATPYTYDELSDQEKFREAIAKERRLEFAFENQRWFDLLRTGKAIEVLNNSTGISVFPVHIQPYQLLYPIPQGQIDASGSRLTQNEGYNK